MFAPLVGFINALFTALYVLLFIRILLSWIPLGRGSRVVEVLFAITEPLLAPIRRLVAKSPLGGPGMFIDFSPIIAFILLRIANTLVVSLII